MCKQKRIDAISMMQAKSSYYEIIKEKLGNPAIGSEQYWHLIKSYGSKIDAINYGSDMITYDKAKVKLFNKHFLVDTSCKFACTACLRSY